ncbi:MAG TPA: methanogenesis marker 2 protein [Methanocorpusculum sp.]|nr:methanogenesis marker 2 protein [Methanocorpusculum sp.]HJJ90628.1 methanogenesis marker 2 protein [Methanocorpusculum sp.]HJJ92596.1 methanogenesis marker 2 protein [Methanocorpusculum sp.]HJK00739.1 methanogenesis marker 2 protein [Methanocorpusculum sp.]HJK02213.1 methanogenesis marker 2 protein [Methanocorpusculum sp.]
MAADNYTPKSVADAVLQYDGVRRKQAIGTLVHALHINTRDVIASYGEDAAVIQNGHTALLLAADGIWNKLMDVDPYWAGYCAILVNVHDIAAMGGRPVAIVDVLSTSNDQLMAAVSRGMHDAATIFEVPIVGGHLHPDAPYNVIDVSILGVADIDNIIYSSKAEPGNAIIAAIDLNGRIHPSAPMNWDSVTMKPPAVLRAQIRVMKDLGEHHLLTAGKDISNPGIIGTLGMLIEASNVGAVVDLTSIPRPDLEMLGITFEQWVRMYPGMGFIMTANQSQVDIVCKKFRSVGMAAQVIGTIDTTKRLTLVKDKAEIVLFNFCTEGITNI